MTRSKRMTTSGFEWPRVTMSDREWLRETSSDYEWTRMTTSNLECTRVTTSDFDWLRMTTSHEWPRVNTKDQKWPRVTSTSNREWDYIKNISEIKRKMKGKFYFKGCILKSQITFRSALYLTGLIWIYQVNVRHDRYSQRLSGEVHRLT